MFPLFELVFPALSILPVEMIAMILRNLDSESLYNAATSNKYFMKVCRGDPILRETMRLQIRAKRELRLQAILNAKKGIVVLRDDPPRMYNRNVQKTIKREKVKPIGMQISSESRVPMVRTFTIVPPSERRNGGGKLRHPRKEKVGPYKNIRF